MFDEDLEEGATADLPQAESYKFRVLLIDDQPMIGEAVRRLLADEKDLTFHYCAVAADAITTAVRLQPTVILQDLVMPETDGLELLRQYRGCPATQSVPVIVLSTKEEPAIKKQAFELGANDYLVKLPDKIELIARIRYHSRAYLNQLQRDQAMNALSIALREKSEFMRIASHDLKNPLTVTLGATRLLEERMAGLDSQQAQEGTQLVQIILRQIDQMRKLVEDYLDAQAIEDGQLQLIRSPFSLNEVARNAVDDLMSYAGQKRSVIQLVTQEEIPQTSFDAARIAQVAINLLGNAIKFSPPGSQVVLRTRVTTLPNEGQDSLPPVSDESSTYVQLEVQDAGPGLQPEDVPKLFGRYAKLSARPTGNEKSTGLGLSICKRLVELHGGRIGACNNEGRGATFWFALPIGDDAA